MKMEIESYQELQAIHGLDAQNELVKILSDEILAEINREVIRTIYNEERHEYYYEFQKQKRNDIIIWCDHENGE